MDIELLMKIPRKYHYIIKTLYKDEDGYWCVIGSKSGFKLFGYKSDYTIHEEQFDKFKQAFNLIKKIKRSELYELRK